MTKVILAYIPVPHLGYLKLIERHQPADVVLLPLELIKQIDSEIGGQLDRDMKLRGLSLYLIRALLKEAYGSYRFEISFLESIEQLKRYEIVIMPDEDISHSIEKLIPWTTVEYDTWFQRWDWRNTNIPKEVVSDYEISFDQLDRCMLSQAENVATKSSDFWRSVGAAVQTGKELLLAFNEHLPTAWEPYINGCMRIIMKPGEKPEICGAIHAEKALFAEALQKGIVLKGRDIYVTTFPCLPCAQMIAKIGMRKLFFRVGYSNQNAQEVLKAAGVEIIRVL